MTLYKGKFTRSFWSCYYSWWKVLRSAKAIFFNWLNHRHKTRTRTNTKTENKKGQLRERQNWAVRRANSCKNGVLVKTAQQPAPGCSSLLYPIPTHFTFIWTNIQTVWPIFMLSELNMFLCLSLTTNLLILLCWVCLLIGKGEGYLRGDQGREEELHTQI